MHLRVQGGVQYCFNYTKSDNAAVFSLSFYSFLFYFRLFTTCSDFFFYKKRRRGALIWEWRPYQSWVRKRSVWDTSRGCFIGNIGSKSRTGFSDLAGPNIVVEAGVGIVYSSTISISESLQDGVPTFLSAVCSLTYQSVSRDHHHHQLQRAYRVAWRSLVHRQCTL